MLLTLVLPLIAKAPLRLEAEAGTLDGPTVASARKGFSGTGYATGLTKPGARIVWRTKAHAGVYEARLAYASSSEKGFEIGVDGARSSGMLPPTGEGFGVRNAGSLPARKR